MPTKKKKYNARFPPARIKKIMQKDEEVGKVASTVPVMLSRLLELFTESLILKTNELTLSVNARTLSTSHLKQVILSERKFDFLKDLVAHIPDVQATDEDGGDSNSDQGNRPRPRGRPKKKKEEGELTSTVPKKRGRRPKAVVPLEEDTLLDEYNSEDSETEDADSNENEDIESTSEDATYDQSMESVVVPHMRKRRRIDDASAAATAATTSSYYDPDSQTPRDLVNDSAPPMMGVEHDGGSANLLTVDSKGSTRETLLLPPPSNVATSWSLAKGFEVPSIEQTANEACVPLNLKTAGNSLAAAANTDTNPVTTVTNPMTTVTNPMTTVTNPMTTVTHDLETYLMQQQQELHRAVGLNFGKTSYHADGGGGGGGFGGAGGGLLQVPPGLVLLAPPPAHQPISHGLRHPLTSVCMMQPPFARSNLLSPTASEFVSRINSPATLGNTSLPGMLLSPVPNTSGHAVHRMPVVPASFPGPGACLARSTSMPHGTVGVASKPSSSSLATAPEDDYDS